MHNQLRRSRCAVVTRFVTDPASVTSSARAAVQSVDPDLPIAKVITLNNLVRESATPQRFSAQLLASFGVIAFVLTALGTYGLISYWVAQRQEIGVRMALGAQQIAVFASVLWQGARLALVGMAVGTAMAFGVARLMSSFLFEVRTYDTLAFVMAPLSIATVAVLACVGPALRATRVQPMVALRQE